MSQLSMLAYLSRNSEVVIKTKKMYTHACYYGAHFTNRRLSINNQLLKFPQHTQNLIVNDATACKTLQGILQFIEGWKFASHDEWVNQKCWYQLIPLSRLSTVWRTCRNYVQFDAVTHWPFLWYVQFSKLDCICKNFQSFSSLLYFLIAPQYTL